MSLAASLWQLVQEDKAVRWGAWAALAVVWFAAAWADLRILLALPLLAAGVAALRHLRRKRYGLGDDDLDLL